LKVPAGYKVPPHTHPNDENITVISGTFNIGMGDKLDEKKGDALKAGGFAHAPKGVQHYAWFTRTPYYAWFTRTPSSMMGRKAQYFASADRPAWLLLQG
jgi:uncharacterized RmlC-like cupin family protein